VLITVSAFREPYEAHLFRGRLEAEGVTAFVAHEMYIANDWPMSLAFGGVKVQVLFGQYEAARAIERACCRGEFRELLQDEIGDLNDPVCPCSGGTEYRKRRPFPCAALAIAVSLTLDTVVPPAGWIFRCERCLKEYRNPPVSYSLKRSLTVAAGMVGVSLLAIGFMLLKSMDVFCNFGFYCL